MAVSADHNDEREAYRRLVSGDADSLRTLFDLYGSLVFSIAFRVLKDSGHAEDVTQEVFLRLWRKPDVWCPEKGSLGAWLSVVARNRAITVRKARKEFDSIDDITVIAPPGMSSTWGRGDDLLIIRKRMESLADKHKILIEMAFFEGYTYEEISLLVGLPLGTVKTRIRVALREIRNFARAGNESSARQKIAT